LHATGITPALGEGPAQAVAAAMACARAAHVPVSFDLNYREALWHGRDPRPLIGPLAQQADLLIGNAVAVRAMLGLEDSDSGLSARLAAQFGCRLVALTRRDLLGPREQRWSARLYDAGTGRQHESRPHEVCVVDRVGGGDSFAAGLIVKLLAGDPPDRALEFAAAAGALKLTISGDFGRASVRDVEAWLRQ
jgi:2-dehydro-3-deoxygluconokinase